MTSLASSKSIKDEVLSHAETLKTLKAELDALKKDHPEAACRLVASKRYGRYLNLDGLGLDH